MNCKDIEAKLIDYLDQRLDAASTEEMQQHLATCAACSREAEELRELFGTMSSGPLETPPSALRESFNMMLQSEINMQATTTIIEGFPPATGEPRAGGKNPPPPPAAMAGSRRRDPAGWRDRDRHEHPDETI